MFHRWTKYGLLLILSGSQVGWSYPWVFFKETQTTNRLELDLHLSYFFKKYGAFFAGATLEYHNSKVDIDLDYRYSFVEKKHYPRFGELSVTLPIKPNTLNLILGFRDFVWNESDRYWNLGLWQPRYLLDVFRPLQNSLPGVYLDYFSSDHTVFTLYFSYFYLPDIIIYPDLKGGAITSKNPYFFQSAYHNDNIKWNVQQLKPFQIETFLQPLFAFQIYHKLSHSEVALSYAYKPKNQIQFFVQSKGIDLSTKDSSAIKIHDLDYKTVQHHLLTIESEMYIDNHFSVFASLFYERPQLLETDEDWVSDHFEPNLTTSFLVYFKEDLKQFGKTIFTLGYIKNFESQNQMESSNVLTEDLELIFGMGINSWRHALSWSMEYQTDLLLSGFQFNFRLNYTLDNQIYAAIFDTSLYLKPYFKTYISGDVLFRFSQEPIANNTSLVSRYQDLSRVLLGIKYVF